MNSMNKLVKMAVGELGICGGSPSFVSPLHVGRPNIADRKKLLQRIEGMLDRCWLTNDGPLVKEFEQKIAEVAGVKHAISMCNATVALEIAIRALGLKGEVIIPSYTFVATAHALQWQEITPVFADMDPITHTIDAGKIERLITPRTTAIIGVHVWGQPCDTDAIQAIADRHGLKVLYDAAHAFGCSHRGRMIGNFGACEVFSFHATKFLNSFEGGAVVTNDDALAAKMRLMRNFGFEGYDRVIYVGTNGKMTEVCAAMGLTSLEAMHDLIAVNRRNHDAYRKGLADASGIRLFEYDPREANNYQYLVIEVDPGSAALNRDELVEVLHKENVLARKYFWPGCHRMEPYRSLFPEAYRDLPATEKTAARVIVLPTGLSVSLETITVICGLIRVALENAVHVREALASKVR
jgi:dTDP-4-amino-4,6-dideoxygalactose transaminase